MAKYTQHSMQEEILGYILGWSEAFDEWPFSTDLTMLTAAFEMRLSSRDREALQILRISLDAVVRSTLRTLLLATDTWIDDRRRLTIGSLGRLFLLANASPSWRALGKEDALQLTTQEQPAVQVAAYA